ncbi:hypothetical protein T265_11308 [Opisthorchis viverrini]|uniref:Uncharacterized protein n=1 Tax=Opisthorchis viverrini TaxID=6198 RepID=A0A074Z9Y9_OPIVI|nr:hypothetical protein T265_11308 [Opisthorchis viverrini]KER20055.1 hypothetical protein T265_11308 [Opisthorchis viverrini]
MQKNTKRWSKTQRWRSGECGILRRGLRFTPQRLIAEAVEITKHHSVSRIEGVELASYGVSLLFVWLLPFGLPGMVASCGTKFQPVYPAGSLQHSSPTTTSRWQATECAAPGRLKFQSLRYLKYRDTCIPLTATGSSFDESGTPIKSLKREHVCPFRRENSDSPNMRPWSSPHMSVVREHVARSDGKIQIRPTCVRGAGITRSPHMSVVRPLVSGTTIGNAVLMSSNKSKFPVHCFLLWCGLTRIITPEQEGERSNEKRIWTSDSLYFQSLKVVVVPPR